MKKDSRRAVVDMRTREHIMSYFEGSITAADGWRLNFMTSVTASSESREVLDGGGIISFRKNCRRKRKRFWRSFAVSSEENMLSVD